MSSEQCWSMTEIKREWCMTLDPKAKCSMNNTLGYSMRLIITKIKSHYSRWCQVLSGVWHWTGQILYHILTPKSFRSILKSNKCVFPLRKKLGMSQIFLNPSYVAVNNKSVHSSGFHMRPIKRHSFSNLVCWSGGYIWGNLLNIIMRCTSSF